MSDPKRYRLDPESYLAEHPQGDFIDYQDYARLKAEVERLTKAGDGLYKSMLEIGCNEMADNFQYDAWWGSMNAWNAAKEGNQP